MRIEPFEMKYLDDYFGEFNEEITKYQWPDPFETIDDAKGLLKEFMDEMDVKETLFYSVISDEGDFAGSVELHGLNSECPEIGVWIAQKEQRKGYAYASLKALLDIARSEYGKTRFFYEADIRNEGSMMLLKKFEGEYDITKMGLEEMVTDSGKELKLQGYELSRKKI